MPVGQQKKSIADASMGWMPKICIMCTDACNAAGKVKLAPLKEREYAESKGSDNLMSHEWCSCHVAGH